jgi:perosamine synthetase
MIKLFSPFIDKNEVEVASKILKSGFWASGAGIGKVLEFEKKFKKYTKSKECIAVDNGTSALDLAMNITDVKNKQVLVPSLTFVSTVHSIIHNGGIPVFVDIEKETLCMDPDDVRKKITDKTAAIVPVHFGGFPCQMNEIQKIAKLKSITVIEDAAHACGAKYNGEKIGSISDFCCFSFHPVKNLAMPKGGAITINLKNSSNIKRRLNALRWCGIDNRKDSTYDITSLGFNHYMDEISASIGIEQLEKLNKMNKMRYDIAKRYSLELNIEHKMPLSKNCSYHLYWIRVKNRRNFMKKLYLKGIETGIHYFPIHKMSYYKKRIKLKVTENVSNEIVSIPMHPNLTQNQVEHIIKSINDI